MPKVYGIHHTQLDSLSVVPYDVRTLFGINGRPLEMASDFFSPSLFLAHTGRPRKKLVSEFSSRYIWRWQFGPLWAISAILGHQGPLWATWATLGHLGNLGHFGPLGTVGPLGPLCDHNIFVSVPFIHNKRYKVVTELLPSVSLNPY